MAVAGGVDRPGQRDGDGGGRDDAALAQRICFGEALEDALDHAEALILEIRAAADRIAAAPHRGERHDNILPGPRHLTIGRAVYWFDVDDDRRTVRILAIFFGGQDHIRHMMARLLGD
ncbi:MAG: type II toxin-antitoxin system RelE/ParE family toxin [Rhodobacteraceae bacterium]|nr:type II toxin-antitoxin system RelE/ParE family toxin [Paracoccaceae bacterium]